MQKKQSQVQQAKYAAVHETRSHEDRRTAAELSARLQKLRTEHRDTAAQAAADLTEGSVNSSAQQAPVSPVKEKKAWPVKVAFLVDPSVAVLCSRAVISLMLSIANDSPQVFHFSLF